MFLNSSNYKNIFKTINTEKKEINFKNISKINTTENKIKRSKIINYSNFVINNQIDYNKAFENLLTNLNKIVPKTKNEIPKYNLKDFKRDTFINYSKNCHFISLKCQNENSLIEKDNSIPFKLKDNENINKILGNKIKRNLENKNENLNKNLEKKPIVSFENGIIRIENESINYDINQNNELVK